MRNLLLTPFVLALVASAPACSDDDDLDDFLDDAADAAADGDFLGNEHATEVVNEFLDDIDVIIVGKSAAIMTAINDNEIALANFALDTAFDPVVLGYAQLMLADHNDNQVLLNSLLDEFNIDLIESPISSALRSEAAGTLRNLDVSFDVDFEYIRAEIVAHAESFVITGELAFQSPFIEFTRFFEDTQVVEDDHQARAEVILRGL